MSIWGDDPLGDEILAERKREVAGHRIACQFRAVRQERAQDAATVKQPRVHPPIWQWVVRHLRAAE